VPSRSPPRRTPKSRKPAPQAAHQHKSSGNRALGFARKRDIVLARRGLACASSGPRCFEVGQGRARETHPRTFTDQTSDLSANNLGLLGECRAFVQALHIAVASVQHDPEDRLYARNPTHLSRTWTHCGTRASSRRCGVAVSGLFRKPAKNRGWTLFSIARSATIPLALTVFGRSRCQSSADDQHRPRHDPQSDPAIKFAGRR